MTSGIISSSPAKTGKLIIAQDAERAAVKAAEAEYMEREMKARSATRPRKSKYGPRWLRIWERGGEHVYHGRITVNRQEVFHGYCGGCL